MDREKKPREWMVPDERDQMSLPEQPDLRCSEHGGVCEVVHRLHGRLWALEERVKELERKV